MNRKLWTCEQCGRTVNRFVNGWRCPRCGGHPAREKFPDSAGE